MVGAQSIVLPPDWEDRWNAAYRRIDQAGYGLAVANAYRSIGPDVASIVGANAALKLGRTVSNLAIRCSRHTAATVPGVTLSVARKLQNPDAVAVWLETIETAAKSAPKSIDHLLGITIQLLSVLDLDGFRAFVRMGIAIGSRSPERQTSFFRLEDEAARQFVNRETNREGFHSSQTQLKHFLSAIWNIRPPLREVPSDAPELMRRRCGLGGGGVRLPSAFLGFAPADNRRIYQAALAHIGAHYRFTKRQFEVGSLKPLQLALISIIEDARVEQLAMRDMPGLGTLWRSFHIARPNGAPVAVALIARLSRALIDPNYADPDGWVAKGRELFYHAVAEDLEDQSLSRRIGGLLGNDLGQMRLQFDANTYMVEPVYRDDNLGIWDFPQSQEAQTVLEEMSEGARIEHQESESSNTDSPDEAPKTEQPVSRVRPLDSDETETVVSSYSEFDYLTGKKRPDWCKVREYSVPIGNIERILSLEETRSDLTRRLSNLIRSSKISDVERIRRQTEGEFLDIDACVDATISRLIGETPDFRIHGRYVRRSRNLSTLVLLDISKSTADTIRSGAGTVLDVERLSTAVLAQAMADLGDPFALAAFCSDSREDVRYFRIKDFGQPYDSLARSRLAGIESGLSTRLGAAMRHAGEDLKRTRSFRRLLLVVTDGEPSDIDVDDSKYLIEDARSAAQALNSGGIDTFCVALQSNEATYPDRIFGRRNVAVVSSVEQLPWELSRLFFRLTR